MYDAIIVGARCAGSATALLLARKGYRVLLVDKATFPSDTISGHFVFHPGVRKLHQWGLLEKVLASGCPPVTKISFDVGDFTLTGTIPPELEGLPFGVGPRRTVLDTILVNAAIEAGAELREGFAVNELLTEGDKVIGIRGRSQNGNDVSEHAKVVIGADGKHSKIAQLVQAPTYNEVPSLTCWYYSYWQDLPCDGLEIRWRHQRMILLFPTNDGLTLGITAWTHGEFHEFRSDIEGNFLKTFNAIPEIAERMTQATRVDKFYGMADVPNFFRKPYGDGWALVGDAGHHKDPTPAYGISDAFEDAELLANALHESFGNGQSLQDSLANYEQIRNQRAVPDHEFTVQFSRLLQWDNPDNLALRQALRHNELEKGRYMAMVAKAIPREVFYAPANMQRIFQQAKQPAS
jgi:flavin-dependent dehydrogenase